MNEIIGRVRLDGSNWRASPGVVGSVGDTNVRVRLAQSTPDFPMRFDRWSVSKKADLGTNIKDGYKAASKMGRVHDSNWSGNRSVTKRAQGWRMKNIERPDLLREPSLGTLGSFSADLRAANVWEMRRTGAQFLPVPAAFGLRPGDVPRGGLYPTVTDIEQGDVAVGLIPTVVSMTRGGVPVNAVVGNRYIKGPSVLAGKSVV